MCNVHAHFHPQPSQYLHLDIWTTRKHCRPLQLSPRPSRAQPHNLSLFKSSSLTPPRVMGLLGDTRGPHHRLQTFSTQRLRAIPRNPVPMRTPPILLLLHLPATVMDTCAYPPVATLGWLDSPIRTRLVSIGSSLWKKNRMWVLFFWLSGRSAYFVHYTRRSVL